MKTTYPSFDIVDDPSLEDRLLFFEKGLREIAHHELLCESKRPEIENTHWWKSPRVYFPHDCDCWLSTPLGSVGLRLK